MSQLTDPQYGHAKLLRPQAGFEAIYQGESTANPIYFYPKGVPLDPAAGTAGISPLLIRGLRVSPGATLLIWLPNISSVVGSDPAIVRSYEWLVGWRLRNIFDYRTQRAPWHLAKVSGTPDTSSGAAVARTVIPAAWEPLLYNQQQTQPTATPDAGVGDNNLNVETLRAANPVIRGPLLDGAGAEGILQQGVSDPNVLGLTELPGWLPVTKVAKGDEMLLAIRRTGGSGTYDFSDNLGAADHNLSDRLGNGTGQVFPNDGVYVLQGVDPGTLTPRSDNVPG